MTLIEILLVIGILVVLTTVGLLAMSNWQDDKLGDGLYRFESVLRMARAEAAITGRRIQLATDAQGGTAKVLWEPDPISAPGEFLSFPATWTGDLPSNLVLIERVELLGASAYPVMEDADDGDASDDDEVFDAVTFSSDRSSDTCLFVMRRADATADQEKWRGVLMMDGVNGTTESAVVAKDDLEVYLEQVRLKYQPVNKDSLTQ